MSVKVILTYPPAIYDCGN